MIILALLLAAAHSLSAEPAPVALTPASTIPATGPVFSPDLSLAARSPDDSSIVNVWRTSDGRQVGRIQMPAIKKIGGDDMIIYAPLAFSPDNRSLLIEMEHKRDWKVGEYSVYLATLDDEKVKVVQSGRGDCLQFRAKKQGDFEHVFCPSADASFSPDGRKFFVQAIGFEQRSVDIGAPYKTDFRTVVMDLDGKVLLQHQDSTDQHSGFGFHVWFGADGHLRGLMQDSSSCEVRDLTADKRAGFLDGCTVSDAPEAMVGGLLESTQLPTWKYWEPDGRRVETSCANCSFARGGRILFELDGASGRIEALDAGMRPLALFDVPAGLRWPIHASPDGGLVALGGDNATQIFRTGLTGRGLAPVAATPEPATPAVDIDAPPAAATKLDPDAYAVVIGVEKYRQDGIPAVDFAARDAQTVYAYLTRAMGFDARNVVLLTDEKATRTDLSKYLGKWLQNRVDAKSRVFVYYAGHGSPNPTTGEGFLMPYEADPAYLEDTAFPIARLYADLAKLPTKDVTVVLDACFSGQGGRSLIAKGERPLVSVKQAAGPANAVVLAAASGAQISASDPQRQHGLLTEYLLEALHGAADARGDGKVTGDEIYAFVKPAVERAARLQNVEQTPTLSGTPGARPWIELK